MPKRPHSPGRRAPTLGPLAGAILVALSAVAAPPAAAQGIVREQPRWMLGASLETGLLVGSELLDGGVGGDLSVSVGLIPTGHVRARLDVGFLPLAESTGPREDPGLTADNALLTLFVGPEVGLALGPVNPYVTAFAGAAVNRWDAGPVGNGSDWAAAWGVGVGLRIRLHGDQRPVGLELAGRVVDPGPVDMAGIGGLGPFVGEEDFGALMLRAGLTLGLP